MVVAWRKTTKRKGASLKVHSFSNSWRLLWTSARSCENDVHPTPDDLLKCRRPDFVTILGL